MGFHALCKEQNERGWFGKSQGNEPQQGPRTAGLGTRSPWRAQIEIRVLYKSYKLIKSYQYYRWNIDAWYQFRLTTLGQCTLCWIMNLNILRMTRQGPIVRAWKSYKSSSSSIEILMSRGQFTLTTFWQCSSNPESKPTPNDKPGTTVILHVTFSDSFHSKIRKMRMKAVYIVHVLSFNWLNPDIRLWYKFRYSASKSRFCFVAASVSVTSHKI